jgi:hypothetical protein
MIPNHKQFLEAIEDKKKVGLRFYSLANSGAMVRVCAPPDYGLGVGIPDGRTEYFLRDYAGNIGSHVVNLLPEQVSDLGAPGEAFDPADFGVWPSPWSVPREWGSQTSAADPPTPRAGVPTVRSLLIATLLAIGLGAQPAQAEDAVAVKEVLRLKEAGLAEQTLVTFIRRQNKNFDLSADNVISLREQEISPAVINAMLESGKNAIPLPPAAEPIYAPQPAPPPEGSPPIVVQPSLDQDVAYFHQELSPYGRWILNEENQWYWQPTVVIEHPDWRPYWDQGRWVYTDHGWYWASDYPWGWAAFHYGRWNLHPHHGWIWYPDREWAPAWVTWRMGGLYCGWAPLPQYSHYDHDRGGLSFHGSHVEPSFGFGLGWNQFSFSYVRELGERPRALFRREADARRIFSQTTVINNYSVSKTIVNNETRPRIVNQGIDPARVAAVRGKPVETVKIQDRRMPTLSRVHERVDARTKTLEVYRPWLTEPSKLPRGTQVVTSGRRTGAPPPQTERAEVPRAITQSSPAAPAKDPQSLAPHTQVGQSISAPPPTESRTVQSRDARPSPAKPASRPGGRPVKLPEASKRGGGAD